jgi:CIC family chloride channel protein
MTAADLAARVNLLLPTLWVCAIAFLLSDEQSIYHSQVESRSRSPAHLGDYVQDVLTGLRVAQFLKPDEAFPLLHPSERLPDILSRLSDASYQTLPVVDNEGHLLGVVSLEELHVAARSPHLGALVLAADLMRGDVTPLQPDDRLDRALELFVENELLALPVVDGSPNGRVIGVVRRYEVSAAYLRHVQGTMVS